MPTQALPPSDTNFSVTPNGEFVCTEPQCQSRFSTYAEAIDHRLNMHLFLLPPPGRGAGAGAVSVTDSGDEGSSDNEPGHPTAHSHGAGGGKGALPQPLSAPLHRSLSANAGSGHRDGVSTSHPPMPIASAPSGAGAGAGAGARVSAPLPWAVYPPQRMTADAGFPTMPPPGAAQVAVLPAQYGGPMLWHLPPGAHFFLARPGFQMPQPTTAEKVADGANASSASSPSAFRDHHRLPDLAAIFKPPVPAVAAAVAVRQPQEPASQAIAPAAAPSTSILPAPPVAVAPPHDCCDNQQQRACDSSPASASPRASEKSPSPTAPVPVATRATSHSPPPPPMSWMPPVAPDGSAKEFAHGALSMPLVYPGRPAVPLAVAPPAVANRRLSDTTGNAVLITPPEKRARRDTTGSTLQEQAKLADYVDDLEARGHRLRHYQIYTMSMRREITSLQVLAPRRCRGRARRRAHA